jgi:predicted transcriptional regulator
MRGLSTVARLHQLRPKPERLRHDQADQLIQAVLPFMDGQMRDHARAMVDYVKRETASGSRWKFVMVSPTQNDAVVNFLADHSSRPLVAMRVWSLALRHLRDDGEIVISRDEIAEQVGEQPRNISTVMTELEQFGAISRRRERVAGMRGQGPVRYYVNPLVATHLAGQARDDAQAAAPKPGARLRSIPGGIR